jgi:PBP1b-binding outer membrane lipoprotein LpoB
MMTKRVSLAAVVALVMLAGCSKPAPTPPVAEDEEVEKAPTAVATAPQAPKRSMGPADYPSKLLSMIDPAPKCQPFRDELEAAGKVQSDDPLPVDMNEVNLIVVRAHEAGCTRKP